MLQEMRLTEEEIDELLGYIDGDLRVAQAQVRKCLEWLDKEASQFSRESIVYFDGRKWRAMMEELKNLP